MRLGHGEFFHPTQYDKPRFWAQMTFLKLVEKHAPEVLQALDEDVRPDYRRALATLIDREQELIENEFQRYYEALDKNAGPDCHPSATLYPDQLLGPLAIVPWKTISDESVLSQRPAIRPLAESLLAWSVGFDLAADWVRDAALRTLYDWERVKKWEPLSWGYLSYGGTLPFTNKETLFEFSHRGWEMTTQTRQEFEADIRRDFQAALSQYGDGLEQLAVDGGWQRSPELRPSKRNENPLRHLEWLVCWQVQGESKYDIALSYDVEFTTVRDGLKKAAGYIGLEVRKGQAGRPAS